MPVPFRVVSGYTGRRPLPQFQHPAGVPLRSSGPTTPAPPGCVCPGPAQPAPVRPSAGTPSGSRAAPRCHDRTSCTDARPARLVRVTFRHCSAPQGLPVLLLSAFLPVFRLVQARPPARPPPTISPNPPQVWGRPSVRGLHRWTTTRRGRAKKDTPAGGAGCPLGGVCCVLPVGRRFGRGERGRTSSPLQGHRANPARRPAKAPVCLRRRGPLFWSGTVLPHENF